ncbi:hypothetical protein CUROG_03600 [Corynebacterium urogenitale]|uniref:Uncharacterized protein n=1 Tax=Corynebacterium urogenitale TaxID=2487892 RepID=A0A5J6Z9U1_9CORY|nr:hypothetical protein CUROG_03600 [Corynebacterium urogenitale]
MTLETVTDEVAGAWVLWRTPVDAVATVKVIKWLTVAD